MRLVFRTRQTPDHLPPDAPIEVAALVRTGHDPAAPPGLRRFALATLEDRGQAMDEDRWALRALNPTTGMPFGGHGAALPGFLPRRAALDAQADRERGRTAGETTGDGGA